MTRMSFVKVSQTGFRRFRLLGAHPAACRTSRKRGPVSRGCVCYPDPATHPSRRALGPPQDEVLRNISNVRQPHNCKSPDFRTKCRRNAHSFLILRKRKRCLEGWAKCPGPVARFRESSGSPAQREVLEDRFGRPTARLVEAAPINWVSRPARRPSRSGRYWHLHPTFSCQRAPSA